MPRQNETVKNHVVAHGSVYVSITGLKIKTIWKALWFWRYAIPSKIQADQSPGLLFSDVKSINGINHTLTAWTDQKAMRSYIYSGIHLKAIKVFRKIATGKTFGYESTELPDWDEVHRLWLEKGKSY